VKGGRVPRGKVSRGGKEDCPRRPQVRSEGRGGKRGSGGENWWVSWGGFGWGKKNFVRKGSSRGGPLRGWRRSRNGHDGTTIELDIFSTALEGFVFGGRASQPPNCTGEMVKMWHGHHGFSGSEEHLGGRRNSGKGVVGDR